jgi:hypothetical protein
MLAANGAGLAGRKRQYRHWDGAASHASIHNRQRWQCRRSNHATKCTGCALSRRQLWHGCVMDEDEVELGIEALDEANSGGVGRYTPSS